ncbi:TonB-dependent receptor [Qipengyuania qiaonensis]|uniref:TonB-dependent receptor n=1 Tax=Qipengyuania qiaonensis TaxID=2867240 RepID=A0ABS7JAP8_9SPHN|nr:TonB-dependent receptor [Qipengyuania qiaonensis]MBX7482939.1 TonB-dependent receptor [Qipengyuania qiaonensis]
MKGQKDRLRRRGQASSSGAPERRFTSRRVARSGRSWRVALLIGTTAFVTPGFASGAFAQEASERSDDVQSKETNVIIVTARKSNESIQSVPISVTAITGEELRSQGANEIQDVVRNVPGLALSRAERGLARYSIRGLSTNVSAPTVAIFLDDISLVTISTTFSGGFDPVFFDMQRLEVLKGPQGTLYGGSAMGGAIKYASNTPDMNRFSVDAAVGAAVVSEGSPDYNGEVVVNAPIIEGSLAFRGGFFYRRDGGYIDAVPGDVQISTRSSTPFPEYTPLRLDALSTRREENINYSDTYALRGSIEWQPSADWSIRPQVFYQESKLQDSSLYFLGRPDFESSFRIPQPNVEQTSVFSLNIEKDLGGVTLTSLTSQFDRGFDYKRDYSFILANIFQFLYPLTGINVSETDTSTFSQELRLASDNSPSAPFRWVVGAYYQDQVDELFQAVDQPGSGAIFGVPSDRLYLGDTKASLKQYALFGEASYRLFDRLELTAGVRLFKDRQRLDAVYDGLIAGPITVVDGRTSEEDGINPKFGLSYEVTGDNLLFASAARGYRPGGPNRYVVSPDACGDDLAAIGLTQIPDSFQSDSVWTYEVGTKNLFADGRLTVNAAAFLTKWKDTQQLVGLPCGFGFTANLGSAEVKGFEFEARVEPIDGLEIGGNAAYTKSEVLESLEGIVEAGDPLPNVPTWMASAYAGYSTTFGNGWNVNLRGEYQYQGRAPFGIVPDLNVVFSDGVDAGVPNPSEFRQSYDVVNLAASIGKDDTLLRLFARNIFNARPQLDLAIFSGSDQTFTIRPRTIGLELVQSF